MKPKRVRGHAIDRPKSYPRNELVVLLGVNAGLRHAEAAGLQGEFMILEKKLVVVWKRHYGRRQVSTRWAPTAPRSAWTTR